MRRWERRGGSGGGGGTARFFSGGDAVDVDERAFTAKALDGLGQADDWYIVWSVVALEHVPTRACGEIEFLVHLGAVGVAIAKGSAVTARKDEGEGAKRRRKLGMEKGIVLWICGLDGGGESRKGNGSIGGGGGGGGGDPARVSGQYHEQWNRRTWWC